MQSSQSAYNKILQITPVQEKAMEQLTKEKNEIVEQIKQVSAENQQLQQRLEELQAEKQYLDAQSASSQNTQQAEQDLERAAKNFQQVFDQIRQQVQDQTRVLEQVKAQRQALAKQRDANQKLVEERKKEVNEAPQVNQNAVSQAPVTESALPIQKQQAPKKVVIRTVNLGDETELTPEQLQFVEMIENQNKSLRELVEHYEYVLSQ